MVAFLFHFLIEKFPVPYVFTANIVLDTLGIQDVGMIMISMSRWFGICFGFIVAVNRWSSNDELLWGDSHHCSLYSVPSVCCHCHCRPSATRGQAAEVPGQWNLTSVSLQVFWERQRDHHSAFIVYSLPIQNTICMGCILFVFCICSKHTSPPHP